MKKFLVMLTAVCTMFICGMTVNAGETSAPAQTTVQVDNSAGLHGNILDIVNDQKYSTEGESKDVKYDGQWDKAPAECDSGDCPACDEVNKCPCGSKCKCKCGKKCPCNCGCKAGKCTCGDKCKCPCCKKDCDCCKEGCKCGDCPKCTPKCDCCGGKCKKDCTCGCKEGKPCTCGEPKADSIHGNIIDAIQGDKCKCDCCKKDCDCCKDGCTCGDCPKCAPKCNCNQQKCKSKKCKKGCKIKK